ncbi:MAG TPA: thiolase family protein [Candidatus Thermoplasmatota archaeon]|nr:thiolase family protein [Candidatus Thermoplasmatota archaeon]
MDDVVLLGACRTPLGKYLGSLRGVTAVELGTIAAREAIARAGLQAADVDEIVMGHVLQAGTGQNPARQVALRAGCPPTVAATTVNKVCGSSLEAIIQAARAIRVGDARVVVAGGMESMSNAPHLAPRLRQGLRIGDGALLDHMLLDGLVDASTKLHMGNTGEIVAERHHVTRDDADRFALRSHQRAQQASEQGWFKDEIVPVEVDLPSGERAMLSRDEGVRLDTSLEKLARLRPVFQEGGVVTAGNASQLSDGGAAMVVMAAGEAKRRGLKPLGVLRATSTAGVKPEWVMEAPIPGVRGVLERAQLRIEDIGLVEHNEAYATASVAVQRALGVPDERFNVHGGAVALGHPLGASGARVLTTLLYAMQRLRKDRGVATLCLGGGNAVQAVVERA